MSELRDSGHRKPTELETAKQPEFSLVSAAGIPHQSCQDSHSTHTSPLMFRNSGIGMSICLFVDSEETSVAGQGNLSSNTFQKSTIEEIISKTRVGCRAPSRLIIESHSHLFQALQTQRPWR